MENKKQKNNRSLWFRGLKKFMKLFKKKPEFIFLGEEFSDKSIVVSNHEGTSAPLALELYSNMRFRFWGAYEMNSGLIKLYKYQTRVYYHEKKHWNLHLARLFCLIASPVTYVFYRGLRLISTYKDHRLKTTIEKSIEALENNEAIVVFPEDSTKGYLKELEGFHSGFLLLAKRCYKKGMDLPIYVAYYKKEENIYIVDKPVYYSELIKNGESAEAIAKKLCDNCNKLAKVDTNKDKTIEKEA